MLVAQKSSIADRNLLPKPPGFCQITLRVHRLSKRGHDPQRICMIVPEQTTACRQHMLLQLCRSDSITLLVESYGQVVSSLQGDRVFVAKQMTESIKHFFLQFPRCGKIAFCIKCLREVIHRPQGFRMLLTE